MSRTATIIGTFSTKNTNQSRDCRPKSECTWIGRTTNSTTTITTTSVVRDNVRRNAFVNGWRAPSPYEATFVEHKPLMGFVEQTALIGSGKNANGGILLKQEGFLSGCLAPLTTPVPSENEWRALTASSLSRLMNSKVNLAMMFASRKQSVETLARLGGRLAESARAARRGQYGEALGALGGNSGGSPGHSVKGASRDYLAWTFGVKQIMSDIYGVYQEATRDSGPDLIVVRSSRRKAASDARQYSYNPGWGTPTRNVYDVNESMRQDIKQVLWYELDSAKVHAAARNGLTNPAYLVYDSLKWSYVFDWLVPVGQYLENLSAELGFRYMGGCNTSFTVNRVNMTYAKSTTAPYKSYKRVSASGGGAASYTRTHMKRTVITDPGAASGLYIKNPFSSFTVITSAAIIGSRHKP